MARRWSVVNLKVPTACVGETAGEVGPAPLADPDLQNDGLRHHFGLRRDRVDPRPAAGGTALSLIRLAHLTCAVASPPSLYLPIFSPRTTIPFFVDTIVATSPHHPDSYNYPFLASLADPHFPRSLPDSNSREVSEILRHAQ